MPAKLRNPKGYAHRITPEAVEAFLAGDCVGLHRALGLAPWQPSPLPRSISALGVDQTEGRDHPGGDAWGASWALAQELQRALIKAAGGRVPKCAP